MALPPSKLHFLAKRHWRKDFHMLGSPTGMVRFAALVALAMVVSGPPLTPAPPQESHRGPTATPLQQPTMTAADLLPLAKAKLRLNNVQIETLNVPANRQGATLSLPLTLGDRAVTVQ